LVDISHFCIKSHYLEYHHDENCACSRSYWWLVSLSCLQMSSSDICRYPFNDDPKSKYRPTLMTTQQASNYHVSIRLIFRGKIVKLRMILHWAYHLYFEEFIRRIPWSIYRSMKNKSIKILHVAIPLGSSLHYSHILVHDQT
jgi:hypothetical protein